MGYFMYVMGEPEVLVQEDRYADTSYLEQEGWEYRLEDYEHGCFEFVGMVVTVTVGLEQWDPEALRPAGVPWLLVKEDAAGIQYWRAEFSASLWGIESDSGADYFNEVKRELVGEVVAQLQAYGLIGDEAEGTPTLRLHSRHYAWMQAAA